MMLPDGVSVCSPLKRASKHRPDGEWSGGDYNVFDGEQHIGRILWTYAAPDRR